jgi:hypothetical protein
MLKGFGFPDIHICPAMIIVQITQHHQLRVNVNAMGWNEEFPIRIPEGRNKTENCQRQHQFFHNASSRLVPRRFMARNDTSTVNEFVVSQGFKHSNTDLQIGTDL